jgi:phage host-nuclease inhibitor protein Gam
LIGKNKLEVPFNLQYTERMKNKKYENIAEEIKKMKTFIKWCEKNYDELTEKEQDLICDFKNDSEELLNW